MAYIIELGHEPGDPVVEHTQGLIELGLDENHLRLHAEESRYFLQGLARPRTETEETLKEGSFVAEALIQDDEVNPDGEEVFSSRLEVSGSTADGLVNDFVPVKFVRNLFSVSF